MTKKKIRIICICILGVMILVILIQGILERVIYSLSVRYSYDPGYTGYIWKDENGNVTAEIWVSLYNGFWKDKSLIFDVDGGSEYLLEGKLKNEKFEVTAIEICEGISY